MRLVKPAWVKHEDPINKKRLPIFTIHPHPDGSRIATGGLDAKVRIWATKPVLRQEAEETATNKSLCTLGMHSGPVLVVRWSHSGKWLASGSDDTIIMIWDLDPHGGGRVFGSDEFNIEGWKALKRLPGHESDVTDLAWAPEDRYLASVGLDSLVIIWSGFNLDPLIKLDGHQGFVKGVTWDPVGQFLATQSDDKSVKVWRTTDWGLEATITKPFEDSPGSTFFRRLSWSPDGAHITASNAMNNNGYVFVAAVIERNQWKSDINLVGHENTVEVAAYNPHIFLRNTASPATTSNICSVVALGADDQSISVWQTKHARPLVVAREVFDRPIMDLAWTWDGLSLYACSSDGTVAVFDFEEHELEGIVPHTVQEEYLKKFGFETRNAEIRLEQQRQREELEKAQQQQPQQAPPPPPAPLTNGTGPPAQQQQVTITKDGRRRIKPSLIGHLSSTGSTLVAPPPSIPTAPASIPTGPMKIPTPASASANVSSADAFATAPILPFSQGTDADGDLDMSVPIDAWGPKGSNSATKVNLKPRTLGGDKKREPVGPVRELRAAAGDENPVVAGARVLDVPSVKSSLTCKVEGCDKDTDTVEIRNSESVEKPTEINYFRKSETCWLDYLPCAALQVVATMTFVALALEDGAINFYTNAGRRAMATVMLDSPCSHLEASKCFLLAISATGMVHSWNVRTSSALFAPVSILSLLTSETTIDSVQLRPNGSHLILLSSGVAVSYDPSLMSWTRVSEPRWADGSDSWTGRQRGPSSGRGVLANMEVALTELRGEDGDTSAIPRPQWWNTALTLGHLESRLAAAQMLDSPTEYKQALLLYAKRLADEGFRSKAEELVKELCGPLYFKPGREDKWQSTVLNMNKRDLLKDVLGIFARSKTLAKLGQDYQEILKKANEKDDY
ncbi:histone transcription regulator HIP1 [Ceratobasidium theobromae]|uniref:Protein HIR n=1 Tax=Ceratobasidium theobromae TaxID=1582974 RepID=A0A5N5Q9U2_9AGAM|nr:histone transcription regulator HIP1 [Ceratobasidium theobromae]